MLGDDKHFYAVSRYSSCAQNENSRESFLPLENCSENLFVWEDLSSPFLLVSLKSSLNEVVATHLATFKSRNFPPKNFLEDLLRRHFTGKSMPTCAQ